MQYIKYQQGDVLLLKVDKETFDKERMNCKINTHDNRAVLAEGEATGHYHAIYMNDMLEEAGVTLCKEHDYTPRNQGLIVEGGKVELRHEEHNTITLEPGYYLQRIVNEYDHISGITRRVAD